MSAFFGGIQRFEQTNDLSALDHAIGAVQDRAALAESIQAFRAVAQNLPPGDRLRPHVFCGLGEALREVAQNENRDDAADEAIYWFQMCAAEPTDLRGKAFFGVSSCLKIKADRIGDIGMLRGCVENARHAVACARDDEQRGTYLIYLAAALALLHRKTEQPEIIQEGVAAAQASVRLSRDEQERRIREKTLMMLRAQASLGGWFQ